MSELTISTLSKKRVFLSLLIFFLIPVCAHVLDLFIDQFAISLMFCMNVGTSILIIYDWNLFGIHYNRAKSNLFDAVLFVAFGGILILLWLYVGSHFLKANIILPGESDLTGYGYARPGMIIAFSLMEAACVSISFKCFTDHLDVRGKELQAILFSGLLFGLFFTVIYLPSFNLGLFFRTYLYNIVLIMFISYLYNQSHSILPGMCAMAAVYLIIMLKIIYA